MTPGVPDVQARAPAGRSGIPRTAWSDPDVFDREMRRVYGRTWLFVAHESEIPNRGDYVTRRMGLDPVIVVRHSDGSVRVLLNACSHRGVQLCRATMGNTSHFRCPYHGWTYNTRGQLRGVPLYRKVYGNLDKGQYCLPEARAELYRGLIFATWNTSMVPVPEFLDGISWQLDALLLAPSAGWEVIGPPQRYRMTGNWKIGADNFTGDSYHVAYTHKTAIDGGMFGDPADNPDGWTEGMDISTAYGHGLRIGYARGDQPYRFAGFPASVREQFETTLDADHLALMDQVSVVHGNIFPNLSYLYTWFEYTGDADEESTAFFQLRQWQPVDVNTTEVVSFMLVPRQAPEKFKRRSVLVGYRTHGGGGTYFEGDDLDNMLSIQGAVRGPKGRDQVSDFSLGTLLPDSHESGPGGSTVTRRLHDEANQRAFYAAWQALMAEDD